MIQGVWAGLAYFAAMFAVGFVLGPIRVFWLEPRLGAVGGVLCEAPILLALSWFAARILIRRLRVPAIWSARLAMGCAAFVFLQAAEFGFAYVLRGASAQSTLDHYVTPAGSIGLAVALAFAAMPLAAGRSRESERE